MADLSKPFPYRPDPVIGRIADWLSDPVKAAQFPAHHIRFRNDRWDSAVGLASLSDDEWVDHFGRFEPLPDNLKEPLALRYHGHQFQVYNPEIGDGRGFLFAQLRDSNGRLLDLGTKGSGTTPHSRTADGRLTLKGAVREILATEMLEALGVYTSKTFAVIETGEELWRSDEPSPTRSAVMTRLSHSHIRIGSFQRLAALEQTDELEKLVKYSLEHYPGATPPDGAPGADEPAVMLMHQVVERLADLAASYMVAGFVHGVLNTDNMNITGESFDYGPWRFLPEWQPAFVAAYFDHNGLYAFGRQPEAIHWNCGQLAVALRQLADAEPLIAALERFGTLYQQAMSRRWIWRLGIASQGHEADLKVVEASEKFMHGTQMSPDLFFLKHRGGRDVAGDLADAIGKSGLEVGDHPYWASEVPETLRIEEVERVWSAIAEHDDWAPLNDKIDSIRNLGQALGSAPNPAGHIA